VIHAITVLGILTARRHKLFKKGETYTIDAFNETCGRELGIDERNFVWGRRLKSYENGELYD
jgi:hypothetical protein